MVAQYYRDPNTGEFVLIPGAASVAVPNEVVIQAAEPVDPAVEVWVDTDDDTGSTAGTPIGAIIAYAGNIAPAGWHMCDGTAHGSSKLAAVLGGANTPDLRDKFIVGTGSLYPHMTTGGSATHQHPLSDLGGAKIAIATANYIYVDQAAGRGSWTLNTRITGTFSNSSGSFGTSVGLIGTTDNGSSLPPYYSLVYIIKKA